MSPAVGRLATTFPEAMSKTTSRDGLRVPMKTRWLVSSRVKGKLALAPPSSHFVAVPVVRSMTARCFLPATLTKILGPFVPSWKPSGCSSSL
jgi:hypothetical protein